MIVAVVYTFRENDVKANFGLNSFVALYLCEYDVARNHGNGDLIILCILHSYRTR